jgi:3-oxoacyl-[acyl-carrier protein] reductase
MELRNKAAIVTGGSKGIGRAIALALAREGANVAISARGSDYLERTARDIRSHSVEALPFAGDMGEESEIKKFVEETVAQFGRLDILVNNAGFGIFHKIADFPTDDWDDMFNLNVRGLFIATRESLPHLRKAGESVIVNVVSLAGKNAFVNGGGYAATKHAVLGFSRCLFLEERENGLRVLAICPGSVDTSFFDERSDVSQTRKQNMLQADDVAESVLHMIRLPQGAMVSEIDIRPTNPKR